MRYSVWFLRHFPYEIFCNQRLFSAGLFPLLRMNVIFYFLCTPSRYRVGCHQFFSPSPLPSLQIYFQVAENDSPDFFCRTSVRFTPPGFHPKTVPHYMLVGCCLNENIAPQRYEMKLDFQRKSSFTRSSIRLSLFSPSAMSLPDRCMALIKWVRVEWESIDIC